MSDVLPTYEAEINGTMRKMLIDTGATTIYISVRLIKELRLKTTKIKARKIKLSDGDNKVANRITTIDVKVGNLPTETLAVYVFPLMDLDLVLGIPWMRKHNPHIDFNTLGYEFTRNGQRYTLYPPSSRPSKLRVIAAEEFRTFINKDPKSTDIALPSSSY
jgi:predicted aspartyl protease